MKTLYVCGFLFSEDLKRVALIKKTKPDWQAGRLNGIGGKVEDKDKTSAHAMEREFLEEAGCLVMAEDWKFLVNMKGKGWSIDFFYATEKDLSTGVTLEDLDSLTEEKVEIFNVAEVWKLPTISNLRWLLPLAIQFLSYKETVSFSSLKTVKEREAAKKEKEKERAEKRKQYEEDERHRELWKYNSGTSFGP